MLSANKNAKKKHKNAACIDNINIVPVVFLGRYVMNIDQAIRAMIDNVAIRSFISDDLMEGVNGGKKVKAIIAGR